MTKNTIKINVFEKHSAKFDMVGGTPLTGKTVKILLDSVPLIEIGEKLTDKDGTAFFENIKLYLEQNHNGLEGVIIYGQIFIDGSKIYEGVVLPKMSFYI